MSTLFYRPSTEPNSPSQLRLDIQYNFLSSKLHSKPILNSEARETCASLPPATEALSRSSEALNELRSAHVDAFRISPTRYNTCDSLVRLARALIKASKATQLFPAAFNYRSRSPLVYSGKEPRGGRGDPIIFPDSNQPPLSP